MLSAMSAITDAESFASPCPGWHSARWHQKCPGRYFLFFLAQVAPSNLGNLTFARAALL